MSAGERIRSARKRKGWTQGELAAEVGCSQQTIVDIEGRAQPQSRFLSAIVRALGENLEYIETGIGSPASTVNESDSLPHFDLETVALRSLDSSYADDVIDSLYSAPTEVSSCAFTVVVDRMAAQTMSEVVSQGDVLFCDPMVPIEPGRYVLAIMPGWRRAELRELVSVAGSFYLAIVGDSWRDGAIPCTPYQIRDEYLSHSGGLQEPALICGTVVFIGRDT